MKRKELTDNDTGEKLFALVSLRQKEPDDFVKIFTDRLYELCKSPEFGSLPISLFAWIARHTDYAGDLLQSQAHYGRYKRCSKTTTWKQFRLLCAAEVLVPGQMSGTIQRYIVNPGVISKNSPESRKKASKRFDTRLTQETLFGKKKDAVKPNKPKTNTGKSIQQSTKKGK